MKEFFKTIVFEPSAHLAGLKQITTSDLSAHERTGSGTFRPVLLSLTLRFLRSLWFFWASVTLSSSLRSRSVPGEVSSALASALLSSVSSCSCMRGWIESWIWTPISLVLSSSLVRSRSASTTVACQHAALSTTPTRFVCRM